MIAFEQKTICYCYEKREVILTFQPLFCFFCQFSVIEPLRINTQFTLGPYDAYEDEEHDDGYISAVRSLSASANEQFGSDQTLVGSFDSSHVNLPRSPLPPSREGAEDSISLRPPGTPAGLRRRPSLLSAVEVPLCVHSMSPREGWIFALDFIAHFR